MKGPCSLLETDMSSIRCWSVKICKILALPADATACRKGQEFGFFSWKSVEGKLMEEHRCRRKSLQCKRYMGKDWRICKLDTPSRLSKGGWASAWFPGTLGQEPMVEFK